MTTTILTLVGSRRDGSFNARLAEAAEALLPEGARSVRFERLADLPHYEEDLDATATPVVADELRAALASADALLLVTPEYNGNPPSLLKNAVDWLSRPYGESVIKDKPALVIGASPSPGGATFSREALVRALGVAGASPVEETFGVASAHEFLPLSDSAKAELSGLLGRLVRQPVAS